MDLPIMTPAEFQRVAESFGMSPERYRQALLDGGYEPDAAPPNGTLEEE